MRAEREHAAAERSDGKRRIQCAEASQEVASGGERAHWRGVDETQVGLAPRRELERQSGQFDLGNLRPTLRFEPLRLGPQAIREACGDAAGAAGALVGRGLRDRDRFQPREAAVGVVARLACQAGIDHHAHAGQGDRGFGDIGREHDAALFQRVRREHRRLLFERKFAVQRQQHSVPHRRYIAQGALRLSDLALAREEHEDVAFVLRECRFDRAAELRYRRLGAARREMREGDRMTAPLRTQPRCVEERREPFAIQGRRHQHDAQVRTHLRLHVQRQRKPEVGGQVAFVEFVEQQCADLFQRRVVLDHPGEDAFGDHLDARARRDLVLEADAIADRLADSLAELPRHEASSRTRGDATWFEQQDLAAIQPLRIEQCERNLGGLAGAGRRFQHEARMRGEAVADARQQGVDGERSARVIRDKDPIGALGYSGARGHLKAPLRPAAPGRSLAYPSG